MSAGLGVFLVWLSGTILSMLVLGVLYHKEIIDWKPEGGSRNCRDDNPPHFVPAIFWWVVGPVVLAGFILYKAWHGLNNLCKFLARISWEKEE